MKRTVMIAGVVVVLVALLAGAAFIGGQLLNGQGLGSVAGLGGKININFQPARELPQTPADERGLFDHRTDNSIFVGPDPVRMGVSVRRLLQTPSHNGPTVEVVVGHQTIVYKDVTQQQFDVPPPAGQEMQQVIEPGRLEEIGEGSVITAWGSKTGDRITADVLVYTTPPVMNAEP